MTQSSGSSCTDCDGLKVRIRTHLNAFAELASLCPTLSWAILKKNIEGILDQQDEIKKENNKRGESITAEFNSTDHQRKMEVTMTTPLPLEEIGHTLDEPEEAEDEQVFETVKDNETPLSISSSQPQQQQQSGSNKRTRGILKESWEGQCRLLLEDLWSRDDSSPFRHPVTNRPDYRQLIDRPMCLSLVQQNLYKGDYETPKDFHKDMMLIFHNSRIYNTDPHSPIRPLTQSFEIYYESHEILQKMLRQEIIVGSKSVHFSSPGGGGGMVMPGKGSSASVEGQKKKRPNNRSLSEENGRDCKKRPKIMSRVLTVDKKKAEQVDDEEEEDDDNKQNQKIKKYKKKSKLNGPQNSKIIMHPKNLNPHSSLEQEKRGRGRPTSHRTADEYIGNETVNDCKLYKCLFCNKCLSTKQSARDHVRRLHFFERVWCPRCHEFFDDENILAVHYGSCQGKKFQAKKLAKDRKSLRNNLMKTRHNRRHLRKRIVLKKMYRVKTDGKLKKIQLKNYPKKPIPPGPTFTNFEAEEENDENKILNQQPFNSIIVQNPFPNFNIEKATTVKVRITQLEFPFGVSRLLRKVGTGQSRRTKTVAITVPSFPSNELSAEKIEKEATTEEEEEVSNILLKNKDGGDFVEMDHSDNNNHNNSTSNLDPPTLSITENQQTGHKTTPIIIEESVQNSPIKTEQDDDDDDDDVVVPHPTSVQNSQKGFKYFLNLLNCPDKEEDDDHGLFSSPISPSSSSTADNTKFSSFLNYRDRLEVEDDDDDGGDKNKEEGDEDDPEPEKMDSSSYFVPCGASGRIPIVFKMKSYKSQKVSVSSVKKKMVSSRPAVHDERDHQSDPDDEPLASDADSSWSDEEKSVKKKKRQQVRTKKMKDNKDTVIMKGGLRLNEALTKFRMIKNLKKLGPGQEEESFVVSYECQLCNKIILCKKSLVGHLKNCHLQSCLACGVNFFDVTTFQEHQAVCLDRKPT